MEDYKGTVRVGIEDYKGRYRFTSILSQES